ncbi:DUF3638 domain-containing protein, partial [bacterium]|nr:DUF3638 domain-containing protein [bacterium]
LDKLSGTCNATSNISVSKHSYCLVSYENGDLRRPDGKQYFSVKGTELSRLMTIDDPFWIECLGDPITKKCDEINLLRLGMQFKYSDELKVFECVTPENLKGYWIDENQYSRGLYGFSGYLKLTNEHRSLTVIPTFNVSALSGYEASRLFERSGNGATKFGTQYKLSKGDFIDEALPAVIVLDDDMLVDESRLARRIRKRESASCVGDAKTRSGLENLFLINLFSSIEQYGRAFELLDTVETNPLPPSDNEWRLIGKCVSSVSIGDPRGAAVFLKLMSNLLATCGHEKIIEFGTLIFGEDFVEHFGNALSLYINLQGSRKDVELSSADEQEIVGFYLLCVSKVNEERAKKEREPMNIPLEIERRFHVLTGKIDDWKKDRVVTTNFCASKLESEISEESFKKAFGAYEAFDSSDIPEDFTEEGLDLFCNRDRDVVLRQSQKNFFWCYSIFKLKVKEQDKAKRQEALDYLYVNGNVKPNDPFLIILDAVSRDPDKFMTIEELATQVSDILKCYNNEKDEKLVSLFQEIKESMGECTPRTVNAGLPHSILDSVSEIIWPENVATIPSVQNEMTSVVLEQPKNMYKFPLEKRVMTDVLSLFSEISFFKNDGLRRTSLTSNNETGLLATKLNELSEDMDVYLEKTRNQHDQFMMDLSRLQTTNDQKKTDLRRRKAFEQEIDGKEQELSQFKKSVDPLTGLSLDKPGLLADEVNQEIIDKQDELSRLKDVFKLEFKTMDSKQVILNTFEKLKINCVVGKSSFDKLKVSFATQAIDLAMHPVLTSPSQTESRIEIGIDDLTKAFLEQNSSGYRKLNPNLSDDDCHKLHELVFNYLQASRKFNQVDRVSRLFNDLERQLKPFDSDLDIKSIRDCMGLIFEELNLVFVPTNGTEKSLRYREQYDLRKYPEIMVFEHKTGFGLRPFQIENLEKLYDDDPKNQKVLQMIMGSGKTKVLLPLLAYKKADGKKLATIVVPEALLGDVVEDLHKMSSDIFGQEPFEFKFDRNTSLSDSKLDALINKLESTITDRHYLITTSKSMHCLKLKYIETVKDYQKKLKEEGADSDVVKQLFRSATKLGTLLTIFFEKADAVIDEADSILSCKNEVNFTIGEFLTPPPEQLNLMVKIHRQVLDLKVDMEKKGTPVTKDNFQSVVKSELIRRFSENPSIFGDELKDYMCVSAPKKQGLFSQLKTLGGSFVNRETVIAFLMDPLYELKEPFPEGINSLLFLLRQELNDLLDITYKRENFVSFGPANNEKDVQAIPYVANNTPSESSRFDQIHEVLNYTIQMCQEMGIADWVVKDHVTKLYHSLKADLKLQILFEDTSSVKLFRTYFPGIDPEMLLDDGKIPQLVALINAKFKQDTNLADSYLTSYVLPFVETNSETLNSNSFDLVRLFNRVQGFTGTLWNSDTFPYHLDATVQPGTDGESMSILLKEGLAIQSLSADQMNSVDGIIDQIEVNENTAAFIDCGAFFKGTSNESVAKALLDGIGAKNPKIQAIVFYEKNKMKVLTKRGDLYFTEDYSDSDIPIENRFTYYDDNHTTGSDIKQGPTSEAIVSVGINLKIRDLFQGMWRMRGLSKSQSVKLMVSSEVSECVKAEVKPSSVKSTEGQKETLMSLFSLNMLSTGTVQGRAVSESSDGSSSAGDYCPTISQLIKLCTKNQTNQLESQLVQSSETQFIHLHKDRVFQEIIGQDVSQVPLEDVETFVKKKEIDPFNLYKRVKKEVTKEDAILQFSHENKARFNGHLPDELIETVGIIQRKVGVHLPDTVSLPSYAADTQNEVLAEAENEAENENEQEMVTDVHDSYTVPGKEILWQYSAFFHKSAWEERGKDRDFGLSELNTCFSPCLKVSRNFASDALRTTVCDVLDKKKSDNSPKGSEFEEVPTRLKSDKQLNCDFIVAIDYGDGKDPDKKHMFMVHEYDVSTLTRSRRDYFKTKGESLENVDGGFNPRFGVFNMLTGEACDLNDDGGKSSNEWLQNDSDMQKMIVQVKFFNGEMVYSKDQYVHLKEWVNSENKADLLTLFRHDILGSDEGIQDAFLNSKMYSKVFS